MSYHLFLDDIRIPANVTWLSLPAANWIIVKNYTEFCKVINEKGIPIYVTYDHDLADAHYSGMPTKEKTGYDCAKFLIENCLDNNADHPDFSVHSQNPVGKQNIEQLVKSYNNSRKNV